MMNNTYFRLKCIFVWTVYSSILYCVILNKANAELTPPYFNLATGRKIYSTATCGIDSDGPELYCKLVGANTEHDNQYFSVIQGQVCDVCDPSRPDKNHSPEYAIDGKETWWQSPPLSRGMKYNEVNLTIDFGQEFHVAYVYIRMGNSPRPGLWTLEKSSDYGKSWTPWQHFSDTQADCETYFGKDSLKPISNDDDVICTTEYSKIVPLENGEIPVMLLENRPSANNYFNSTLLQEWTRATNVRIRLRRTKNLLGHLMSVVSKDPSVTRRYFYSIKDISIGGRCMCNGHADTCDVLDLKSPRRLLACRCQHRTCGIQCNECCPGFEQKKWRQNTNAYPFQCEPCNCFGHSNTCVYDAEVDNKSLSLDIHGIYEGGGVCKDCRHNTIGINCNKCKSKFYRPYGKSWNETDVCTPCNCDYFYSTGNCKEETGDCECRVEFQPPNCDSCAYGYFDFPNCRECECNLNGTISYHCSAIDGKCPCRENFSGHYCKECAEDYYQYPECIACNCNEIGSTSNNCNSTTGSCNCLRNFGGEKCERCRHGYYSYPDCIYCDCDIQGSLPSICNKETGQCMCKEGFGGPRCDQCIAGYFNYPTCVPCNCSSLGSTSSTCDITGKCSCLRNFAGKQCTLCSAGFYSYPECLPCNCDSRGSEAISCNLDGQCSCRYNFDDKKCGICKEGFYNFPACEECNCDPAGVIAKFAGCGSVPAGELCQCKERVTGRICNQCKPLYWNLNTTNSAGCEVCDCFLDGTVGSLDTCDSKTGQCTCKPFVGSRQCKECNDGTFDLFGGSLFGCKDCACDIGGSRNSVCDKVTGQCSCHPRIAGRSCNHPLTTHYFPTLYQFQFEYEDGYTPSGAYVRYQFDDEKFPGFSGKGYAVFSNLQSEVLNEVNIFKSSVYRMVIRYINPTKENVTGSILITSDNPSELDQSTKALLKPSARPGFITVSGFTEESPSALVLDPGRYTISLKTEKPVLLDYFVLLPAAYYEASLLSRKIENPCELGNLHFCRHYGYPSVNEFHPDNNGLIRQNGMLFPAHEVYEDAEHLSIINRSESIPVVSNSQKSLLYNVLVPSSGLYIVVVDYITDRTSAETYILQVKNGHDSNYGFVTLYPCFYTMPCRQPVIDSESREKMFILQKDALETLEFYHQHDDFGEVALLSVTAIPLDDWSIDYITPKSVCVMESGRCLKSTYRSVPDSKKIEFASMQGDNITTNKPPTHIFDYSENLVFLGDENSTIEAKGKVLRPDQYVILVKYYQPNHPEFKVLYTLESKKQIYDGKFNVQHCPSNIGCRALILPSSNKSFTLDDEFTFQLKSPHSKGLWAEYVLIVPIEEFNNNLLEEEKFDQTKEFIQKCGQNHFHMQLNASEYCRKSVFSLTAEYNNGALPCNCDYDGSTSFECDPFGGQCPCKPNIIGRQCESCRTGYWGFPDCKHCDCPLTALCQKDTGECICPPHVIGEKCDMCEPFTYGFHQIIGCEECNCNPLGVLDHNLQCDGSNGSCICGNQIEGRTCDKCVNGFYNFPHCSPCRCNVPGTTFEVCDKTDESCFCKKNVIGHHCERCADGAFNLQASNPEGCTKCFCFGKTNRCESAYLRVFNVSILKNTSIASINVENGRANIKQWDVPLDDMIRNDTTLQTDFVYRLNDQELIYFGMLSYFSNQNNHLTAYGGDLRYTLYYTTGPFGSALHGPDVILHSKYGVLLHRSYEQPASDQVFHGVVKLLETNFHSINNTPITREEFMMALRDLYAIYIRASYWEQSVVTQISDVYMSIADEDENFSHHEKLPVEKCFCPLGYTGLSCEVCAPGYYRDLDGPFGGYCIPCECNRHADTCDCNTGICEDCKHNTKGDHCEQCIAGYHGNATFGTPSDCMICACPLPYESNNFAESCEISENGDEIHCVCNHGYTGARCESCAIGYYGQPEKHGDYCKPCECSGNIDTNEPDSCDTVTGECLKCLNNTHGKACNLCAPGYYGDAVKLKDCKSCDCEILGTEHCDSFVGTCHCHSNVIGNRCDRCEADHYGYDSGMGCNPCDCGFAAKYSQCDPYTGQCSCMPGVDGRQCDQCASDYWNYNASGCTPCACNKGYSRGFGCNPQNGQCECLPGVIGSKCDTCPYRWVLIKNHGCIECNNCIHALLDATNLIAGELDPVFSDFKTVALSYFTSQKLSYIENYANVIDPEVKALDPKRVNLSPSRQEVETLKMDIKGLTQQISITGLTAGECIENGDKLLNNARNVLNSTWALSAKTFNTINDVENFENSFQSAASTKAENAMIEVKIIFDELVKHIQENEPDILRLKNSQNILADTQLILSPVMLQKQNLLNYQQEIQNFDDKLNNLQDWSVAANGRSQEISQINIKNQESLENSQFGVALNQTTEVANNIKEAERLIINGVLILKAIDENLAMMKEGLQDLKENNKKVDDFLPRIEEDYDNIQPTVEEAEKRQNNIIKKALNITEQYSNITSSSDEAIKASRAYSDISDTVAEAKKTLQKTIYATGNATDLSQGVYERAVSTGKTANLFLKNARESFDVVLADLQPHLNNSAMYVGSISDLINMNDKKLEGINVALEDVAGHFSVEKWESTNVKADSAKENSGAALAILNPIVDQVREDLELAKKVPKNVDISSKDIGQTTHQVDKIDALLPRLSVLATRIDTKQTEASSIGSDIGHRIDKLKKKIEIARNIANGIGIGVTFQPNTVLELKPPESLARIATASKVSVYFNTTNPNGFLFYIGNENKTGIRPRKSQDFMAVEIENGYPVLSMDLGNGPEKIINEKYVADGVWYQAVVDRIGNHVNFSIVEELSGGSEQVHQKEHTMPGTFSVFDVDENSKIYVGGYSADFAAPEDLRYSSFEGQIEDLKIGDEPVGLWNFVDGGEAMKGAKKRNKLVTQESSIAGYRFNGNGYVILDAKPHHFKTRSTVHFAFKASKDSYDGLLFYAGEGEHFISVELRGGSLYFQYKLGSHKVIIGTNSTLNDDRWHRVEAERDGRKGVLKVDGKDIYQEDSSSPGVETSLDVSDVMYFGGHPSYAFHDEVISKGFDGCINDVVVSGTPIDLSRNYKAYGIRPGCPEKFSSLLSYSRQKSGYLRYENISSDNDFHLTLSFRTRENDGLIFVAIDRDRNNFIGLSISNGNLLLQSTEDEVATTVNKYNDGQWHFVTVTYNERNLILSTDDSEEYRTDTGSLKFPIKFDDIYFGGLPLDNTIDNQNFRFVGHFAGCINDVTLNGNIINFARSVDKISANTDECPDDIFDAIAPYDASTEANQHYIVKEKTDTRFNAITEKSSEPSKEVEEVEVETTTHSVQMNIPMNVTDSIDDSEIITLATIPKQKVPQRKRPEYGIKADPVCKLPVDGMFDDVDVSKAGYRFGTYLNSRLELKQIPNRIRKGFEISMEFKTDSFDGIMLYAADASHLDFVALYMKGGKVHFTIRIGSNYVNISSSFYYNDDNWHKVLITRQQFNSELIVDIDDINQGELPGSSKTVMAIQSPIYIGNVDSSISDDLNLNLQFEKGVYFGGCIRAISIQNRIVAANNLNPIGLMPCSEDIEKGVYFNKGYVKLRERFNVGKEFAISFDIKPRTTTGMLLSVHGRSAYLILQMLNGTITFTVDNGEGPIVATFEPNPGENLCDGNWRTVEAIKSQYVITLIVNSITSQPGIGSATHLSTDTTRPLFLGGHPHMLKVRGLIARKPFIGCIRNLKIKDVAETIHPSMTFGDVRTGVCPVN